MTKCVILDFNENFFGIILDNTLHWKQHIDVQIIKLNVACYAIRTLKHMVPQETLLMVYFSSTLLCPMALFFGGNSP
jgi:hypothetical protein